MQGDSTASACDTSIAPETSPKSNVFKNALHKFGKKEKSANILQSASNGFFGRKKTPPSFPGSVKQASFCGAQLPPVWATPPPQPMKSSNSTTSAQSPAKDSTLAPGPRNAAGNLRAEQFAALLKSDRDSVDLERLRELSWGGIPTEFRPLVWKLLLSYVPAHKDRRDAMLQRKRSEYRDLLNQYYYIPDTDRGMKEQETLHQILIDIPRTNPDVPLFQIPVIQKCMERVLYIWAIRHPASGYVQGINDLLTPFVTVFLSALTDEPEDCDVSLISNESIEEIEADSYWCLTKLLDDIQDHYTFSQPGIQRMVQRMEDLVRRCDGDLYHHIVDTEQVQFVQFVFRWMNCLLMRECPLNSIIRLWDTYLCEENGFESFHIYVCAAILMTFGENLKEMQFQDMVLFLQNLPTKKWNENDIEPLLSRAYILQTYFADAPNHIPHK